LHRFDPRIAGASVLAIVGDGWRIGGSAECRTTASRLPLGIIRARRRFSWL
jgi:hypothetical protein